MSKFSNALQKADNFADDLHARIEYNDYSELKDLISELHDAVQIADKVVEITIIDNEIESKAKENPDIFKNTPWFYQLATKSNKKYAALKEYVNENVLDGEL